MAKKEEIAVRVALAQIDPTVGDLSGNARKIAEYIKSARSQQADLVLFPELALCGYPPEDLLLKRHFVKDNITALNTTVKAAENIIAVVGFVDEDKQGNLYNAAAVISGGTRLGVYHKIELPNYGVFDEKRYFAPGAENVLFTVKRFSFGVTICEDIWLDGGPHIQQACSGANLLVNISASPYHAGKIYDRERVLSEQAKKIQAHICYVNLVGGQDELVFDGGSFVIDPQGKTVILGKQFEEAVITADLKLCAQVEEWKSSGTSSMRFVAVPEKRRTVEKTELPAPYLARLGPIREIYDSLVCGTRGYIRKNGFKKAAVGLSGGIDSAVTAIIACDAIGTENVIAVSMPSQFSSEATQTDAHTLAHNLTIRLITVPIQNIFNIYLAVLEKEFAGLKKDSTEENLQARIRGNILMALSNKFGWLILTTGNKSEASVGYCTLYGDMAGGFGVIKDVPKTLIYDLARFKNKASGKELIPKTIISREPSAELRANQKDEDSLPPYAALDPILKAYIEQDKGYDEIVSDCRDPNLVREIIQMVDRNEYKRRQASPGIKITPKAFGKDRRLPITNKYRGF